MVITVIISWFLADILTGFIHWWQDHYLSSNSKLKIFISIAKDNELHHLKPEAMGLLTIWENINTSAPYGLASAMASFYYGFPAVVWLTFFFASFGNLVHRYAHVPRNKVPVFIKWLQKAGIFISPKHHNKHHRSGSTLISKSSSYERFCPMTDWMNPILDSMGFWSSLELVLHLIGIKTVKED